MRQEEGRHRKAMGAIGELTPEFNLLQELSERFPEQYKYAGWHLEHYPRTVYAAMWMMGKEETASILRFCAEFGYSQVTEPKELENWRQYDMGKNGRHTLSILFFGSENENDPPQACRRVKVGEHQKTVPVYRFECD